jgi:hypothetical protein
MSWLTVLWSMAAAASLTLGAINVIVWLFDRRNLGNLLFAVIAATVAVTARQELGMMHAETPAEYSEWIRWCHVPAFFMLSGMVLFVRTRLGTGRLWLMWTVIALRFVILLGNFLVHPNFNWAADPTLQRMNFLGEQVSVIGHATVRSWQWLATLSTVLFSAFVLDASLTLWRKGGREERRRVVLVGGGMMGFVFGPGAGARSDAYHPPVHPPPRDDGLRTLRGTAALAPDGGGIAECLRKHDLGDCFPAHGALVPGPAPRRNVGERPVAAVVWL